MADNTGLTDEERAELEQLRAEKAAAQQAAAERAEKAELERLRAEKAKTEAARAEDARIAAERERGRKLMEPDDEDLKMPVGQKIVIAAVVLVGVVMLLMQVIGK
jgi:predicted aminopeptidase